MDGSRVEASPAQVVLTFDEAVHLVPGAATVLDDSGTTVSVPPAHLAKSGKSVVIPLKPHLPRGSYTATWRVVSADTHVVSGSITFGVRQDAVTAPTSSATAVGSLEVVSGIGKGATYLGAALLFGVLAAGGLFWPDTLRSRRMRWTRRIGWVALTGGTLAELLLQGPQAVQSGWSGVARLDDMPQTLDTTYGVALVVRLAALIAVAASGPWARMPVDSAATSRRPVAGAPVRAGATGLAETTVLVSQPPARDTYGPATTITAPLGADRMIVEIDSTRRGPQHFTLTAVDGEGRPVRLQDLSGSLSSTGIASLDLRLERGPGLSWHSVDAVVPRPGTWTIHLDASIGPASGWATVADYTTW